MTMVAKPLVMGILNVTPDSFSDGGRYFAAHRAVRKALDMAAEGADVIDIGGESSRPGAEQVPVSEELRRVIPVIRNLREQAPDLVLSVDTRRAVVAQAALEAGVHGINDITALSDPDMAPVAAFAGCTLYLMHMQGSPRDMQVAPCYRDVVREVLDFLGQRVELARAAGVAAERIWVDPGIGFGKNDAHNSDLIRGLPRLAGLGRPVLVGVSRKSYVGRTLNLPDPQDRLEGSLALAAVSVWLGAAGVRVHDVLATRRVVDMVAAVRGTVHEESADARPIPPCGAGVERKGG